MNEAKNEIILHLLNESHSNKGNNSSVNNSPPTTKSYASITQNNTPANKTIIPVSTNKPNETVINNTEKRLTNILKNNKVSATILKTTCTDKGNVVMHLNNNEEVLRIKEKLTSEFGNKIKINNAYLPKIKIVSVPSYYDTSDLDLIKKDIIDGNEFLKTAMISSSEIFNCIFAFSGKAGKSLVFKCSPNIRKIIHDNNNVLKVQYKQCKIYDRIHVSICTKCCKPGHSSKVCKSEIDNCTYCAESHNFQNCPFKSDKSKHKCFNCYTSKSEDYKKLSSSHNCFTPLCPMIEINKIRIIQNTDFGISNPTINAVDYE